MTIMCFQRIYEDILKLVLKNGEKLYGKDLIQFVYSAAREVCFNFEKCLPEKYKCDFELCREENAKKVVTAEEATKIKDEGTKFFRNNKLDESLDCYNRFLQLCHTLKDEEVKNKMLYQAYANRSLVLFRGGKWVYCLDDILGTLHYSPNPKAEYMVLDRKARCLLFMKKWAKARKAFEDCLEAVKEVKNLDEKMRECFIAQVETHLGKIPTDTMIEAGKEVEEEEFVMDDQDFLIKLKDEHKFCKGFSSKIELKYNEVQGRHTVAKEDIQVGEVIACEDANVSFTHFNTNTHESKACHHCVGVLGINKHPSPVVPGIYFCSFPCFLEATQTYHLHEKNILQDYIVRCKFDESTERSGCIFLALRAVAKKPWTWYCDNKRSPLFMRTDPKYGVEEDLTKLDDDEYKLIHLFNLVHHEDQIEYKERIKTAIRSVMILESLKQSGYFKGVDFQKEDLSEQELIIGALLHKLQLGFTFNVHLIYRLTGEMDGNIPLDMVGSALYHFCIILNHSCGANTTRFFQVTNPETLPQKCGGQMLLVAKRGIKKGEEITNNYGIHHNNMPLDFRKNCLKNGYHFDCQCHACSGDFPLLKNVESAMPSKKVGKEMDLLISQYQRLFSEGCLEEALDRCCDYIKKLETNDIKYPHRNYEIGTVAMNSCWWGIIARQNLLQPGLRIDNVE